MMDPIRSFGPLVQLGYVVDDLRGAIAAWAARGVGPWTFLAHVDTEDFEYRGIPSTVDMSIAISYMGGMQLELIQQHCDQPTLYRDFRVEHGEGLQHLGYFPDDFEVALAAANEADWSVGQQGFLGSGRFVYFDTQHHPGTVVEICEINDRRRTLFADIESQTLAWDRKGDPVRDAPGHGRSTRP